MKKKILFFISLLSKVWLLIPAKIRVYLFTFFYLLESRNKDAANGLKNLFKLKDKLEWVINERALSYGKNIHPKHKLTRYHYFFIERINNGETVLDIGCGYGAVARSIAKSKELSTVYGIDIDSKKINQARSYDKLENLFSLFLFLLSLSQLYNCFLSKVIIAVFFGNIGSICTFISLINS